MNVATVQGLKKLKIQDWHTCILLFSTTILFKYHKWLYVANFAKYP